METKNTRQDSVTESTGLLYEHIKRKHKRASKCRKVTVLLACVMQQILTFGLGYGLSVMYAELIVVFNALRTDAAVIQSLNMGLSTSAGILFVGVVKKLGPGTSIVVGGIIGSLGLFASAFAEGLVPIILCTGVLSGLALSMNIIATYILIGLMFPDNASVYLIILTSGISVGQFIYPILFDLFISLYSWSGAFILMAALTLHSVPCGFIIYFSKEYYDSERWINHRKSSFACDTTLLKDSVQWIIMVNAFLLFATVTMEAWFIVDHTVSRGFTRESGSILVSVIGIGSFIGRFVGILLRYIFRVPTTYHWVYLLLVVAALHALIINLTDFSSLVVACLVYGIVFATSTSQLPAVTVEASGVDRYPQAMALVNVLSGLGDIFGGLFGGMIKDVFGEYDIAFYTASGVSIYMSAATVAMVCIERRRKLRTRMDTIDNMTLE